MFQFGQLNLPQTIPLVGFNDERNNGFIWISLNLSWMFVRTALMTSLAYLWNVITSGARSAERVVRGLVEKSKYERPDTTRRDTTRRLTDMYAG